MNTDKNIRILISGGSGFIGTNLVDYYLSKNFTVLNIDRDPPRNKAHNGVWQCVDILDFELLNRTIQNFNPTHVLHLAARTDLDEKKNIEGYNTNTEGQKNILLTLDTCPKLQRAIFTSSMLVCKTGYSPKNYDDYNPSNLYGESKVLGEKIIKNWKIAGYEWLIVRPTSIWGPWFGAPYNEFFRRVKSKTYLKISGKSSTKTFGFVGNTVDQIDQLLFLESTLVNKKTFYLGDSPPLNINQWADMIALKLEIKLITIPILILKVAGWVGDCLKVFRINFPVTSFRVSNMTTDNVIELLQDTINIIPHKKFSLSEGIGITLKWLIERNGIDKTRNMA